MMSPSQDLMTQQNLGRYLQKQKVIGNMPAALFDFETD